MVDSNGYRRGGKFVATYGERDENLFATTAAPPAANPTNTLGTSWTQPQKPVITGGPNPPSLFTPQTGGPLPPELRNKMMGTGLPPSIYNQGTGGGLPADLKVPIRGGPLPPQLQPSSQIKGGPLPPDLGVPPTGGPNPPQILPGTKPPIPSTGGGLPPDTLLPPRTGGPNPALPQQSPRGGFAPVNVVQDTLSQIADPNGAYMRNAARRGLEQAQARGVRAGSSIAAGASQRAALESAMPLVNQAMGLQQQREGFAFQGEQNQLNRNQDYTRAQIQDWLSSNQFNREFYGTLRMMPINSSYQLQSLLQQYALENPEVYTPSMINGISNFFSQNFSNVLAGYFGNNRGGG